MKRHASALALPALLALTACGGGGSAAENTADQLEQAAEQSTPEAAAVLENAADAIEDQNDMAPTDQPGSAAQQALQNAGNAAAATVPAPQQPAPSLQAQPHRAGDPVPPPKKAQ